MKALLPILAALPLLGAASATAGGASGRCGDSYRVARYDTLYSIARRCGGSVAELMARNRIADPRRLEIGRRLVLGGRAEAAARTDEAHHARRHPPRHAPHHGGRTYTMQAGDTLYSLARWSRVGLAALLAANPGIDPRAIEIGDPIRLPRGAAAPDAARLRERGPAPPHPRPRAPEPPRRDEADRAAKPDDSDYRGDEPEDEPDGEPEGM